MSVQTWMAEFYPLDAIFVPVEDAVAHSLQKWRGLTSKSLKKHGITVRELERAVKINAQTCALCLHHLESSNAEHDCSSCPIYKVRGSACDMPNGNCLYPPYVAWRRCGDPEPMISLLERVQELYPPSANNGFYEI